MKNTLILFNLCFITLLFSNNVLSQKGDTIRIIDIKSFMESLKDVNPDTLVYMASQYPATFHGGMDSLNRYVKQHVFKHFVGSVSKDVLILCSVIIEKNGCISAIQILPSNNADKSLESSVINALYASPEWFPASQDGKKLRFKRILAFRFP